MNPLWQGEKFATHRREVESDQQDGEHGEPAYGSFDFPSSRKQSERKSFPVALSDLFPLVCETIESRLLHELLQCFAVRPVFRVKSDFVGCGLDDAILTRLLIL